MNFMISTLVSCNRFCVDYFKKNTIRNLFGPLAQLVEQFPFKEWVIGSNPIRLTKNRQEYEVFFNFKIFFKRRNKVKF